MSNVNSVPHWMYSTLGSGSLKYDLLIRVSLRRMKLHRENSTGRIPH